MTQDKIKLFIVDLDSIYRLGFRTAIAPHTDFEIVGEGNIGNGTWRELTQGLVLNVLIVGINQTEEEYTLEFCQQIRQLYPQLPLFLLTPNFTAKKLARIRALGIRGYCDRRSNIDIIIEGLHSVAYGNNYWQNSDGASPQLWQTALSRLSKSGRLELAQEIERIDAQLANPNLSDWEKVFLVGKKRELLTVRWLSNRLVTEEIILEEDNLKALNSSAGELVPLAPTKLAPLPVFEDSANKTIFERVVTDIQIGLVNRSNVILEIDILQPEISKSLCHLILKELAKLSKKILLSIP